MGYTRRIPNDIPFYMRAQSWNRASRAEQLIPRLQNVVARQPGDYNYEMFQYTALPPCHDADITSKSFTFGTHPSGGLLMRCWGCHDLSFYDRVEHVLGCAPTNKKG